MQLNSISADSYTYNPAKQAACQNLARHKRTNLANNLSKMKPPNHPTRSPIPLYLVPPISPNSKPKCRHSSELSDGILPLASSSSIPAQSHHRSYIKTVLGDKNILNSVDLKAPACTNVMVSFHSGFKLAVGTYITSASSFPWGQTFRVWVDRPRYWFQCKGKATVNLLHRILVLILHPTRRQPHRSHEAKLSESEVIDLATDFNAKVRLR